jgi:hypothetical protein
LAKEYEEALNLAEQMFFLSNQLQGATKADAILCYGLALSLLNPAKAISYLQESRRNFSSPLAATRYVRASLFLARTYLALNEKAKALEVIAEVQPYLSELSQTGLRLLSGPPELFENVWALIRAKPLPLYIKCFGRCEVRLQGRELPMPLRWLEILVLMANNPNGLTGEQLLLLLYGDDGNLTTLKATLSKMRQHLPISSRIYKIDAEFKADFLEINNFLDSGNISQTLELYQGPFLVQSNVPAIVEIREVLDERIRQVILQSGNDKAFEYYLYIEPDDVEILEAWWKVMPENHPQRAFAKAKLARLQTL